MRASNVEIIRAEAEVLIDLLIDTKRFPALGAIRIGTTGEGNPMPAFIGLIAAIDADEATTEAIDDWHYWLAQGYTF